VSEHKTTLHISSRIREGYLKQDNEIINIMVHKDIQKIIDTMYNLYGKEKDKENVKKKHGNFDRKTPLSWVQTYMIPSVDLPKEATSPV